MKASHRYWLFQIPGILLLALILAIAWYWKWLSGSTILWIAIIAFAKDLILYPIVVNSCRQGDSLTGSEKLIGMQGLVLQALEPKGFIRIRGERWQAESNSGETLPPQTIVAVIHREGLLLFVEAVSQKDN